MIVRVIVMMKSTVNSQYYFTLHASNGQVIGKSEMYTSTQARDGGIAAVKAYGPSAPVVDLTCPIVLVQTRFGGFFLRQRNTINLYPNQHG